MVADWRGYLAAEIAAAHPERSEEQVDDLLTTLGGVSMAITQEIRLLDDPAARLRARRAMRVAADLPPS